VGSIIGAIGLATAALFSLFRLTRIFIRFMDNYEAISRVVKFLRETPDILDAPDVLNIKSLTGEVEFENVHFSYTAEGEAEDQDCLTNINFSVPAGKTVAVVGPSGSGETTMINLLMRFMDPTEGIVKVGGV